MLINYQTDENGRPQNITTYPVDPSRPVLELPDDFDLSAIRNYIVEAGQLVFSELPAPQPSVQEQIMQLKQKLLETDYIATKAIDALISADSLSGIFSVLAQIRSEYEQTIAQRKSWREQISVLEAQEGGQDDT